MKRDIILIGMPGSGKTTVGKAVADMLKAEFCDTDSEVEKAESRSPAHMITESGEAAFRKIEAKILKALLGHGRVTALGGGTVCTEEAVEYLKKSNSVIVYISRPLDLILRTADFSNRPLTSTADDLRRLYDERHGIYESLADIVVLNNKSIREVAEKIVYEVNLYENNDN